MNAPLIKSLLLDVARLEDMVESASKFGDADGVELLLDCKRRKLDEITKFAVELLRSQKGHITRPRG